MPLDWASEGHEYQVAVSAQPRRRLLLVCIDRSLVEPREKRAQGFESHGFLWTLPVSVASEQSSPSKETFERHRFVVVSQLPPAKHSTQFARVPSRAISNMQTNITSKVQGSALTR
ncbi:hypothetical protein LZL87_001648 [Fusarium oxysporum]|nr:hypothetical protein LZL87_001648 [Fusarium oxysporum]